MNKHELENTMQSDMMELLAPAGSYETFCQVLLAGADAVYAGGQMFGARAYANNFSTEELVRAIELTHLLGKRFYLTVNTLVKEEEFLALEDYLIPLYEAGLDAVIVQDFGVVSFLQTVFPELPLHASTQMTVASAYGAQALYARGFEQLVLPRELSLAEIRTIHEKTPIRLEVFVHGALCVCYSGQCLMSSVLGGRSGNRGRCAQPCRLPYHVSEQDKELAKGYPLSPKDLCAINTLCQLKDAGVTSLKIEGRMKQANYAAGVTRLYRKYLDRVQVGEDATVSKADKKKLLAYGNRSGFTNGYLLPDPAERMVTLNNPSHEKANNPEEALADPKDLRLPIYGKAEVVTDAPASLCLSYKETSVTVTGATVDVAAKRPVDEATVREKLSKLGNTPFVFSTLEVAVSENAFLPMPVLNHLRSEACDALVEKLLAQTRRTFHKADWTTPVLRATNKADKTPLLACVFRKEQFAVALQAEEVDWIGIDCHGDFLMQEWPAIVADVHAAGKKALIQLPVIFRNAQAVQYEAQTKILKSLDVDAWMVRAFDEIFFLNAHEIPGKIVADHNLYAWNGFAKSFFAAQGVSMDTAPVELNRKEWSKLGLYHSQTLIYGYLPLMTSAQCVLKNTAVCRKNPQGNALDLTDRYGKTFPVQTLCDICANRIYNCVPVALFGVAKQISAMEPAMLRMDFTREDKDTMQRLLRAFQQAFRLGENVSSLDDFTYGHYKRGVE